MMMKREEPKAYVPFGSGFGVRSTGHFGPKVPMNHTPQRPVTSESTHMAAMWLLMVITKELGTYQPVDVLTMGGGVLCALVMTG
jgi:hypothetical protein